MGHHIPGEPLHIIQPRLQGISLEVELEVLDTHLLVPADVFRDLVGAAAQKVPVRLPSPVKGHVA